MFDLILYQPEIPPNTGNIIRLCANTGVRLHLVKPLGFSLDDKQLLRAGLDYHEFATIRVYESWPEYDTNAYAAGDAFLLGPETRGLPRELIERVPEAQRIRVPMRPDSRSLNLSNAAAVVVYEALRQTGFEGCR
jgi:tRNA (cytidine/uridine-2'-O-)-methyltransferase